MSFAVAGGSRVAMRAPGMTSGEKVISPTAPLPDVIAGAAA